MTYYLKYRSSKIDELDLATVRESLGKFAKGGRIPHVLLFAGPKGSGKTSAARIMARVLNCTKLGTNGEPCGKCDNCIAITKGSHMDVIEIDAASHRGIEEAKALIDSVRLAPINGKKKVYIIDEAHMLTTEAGNALLKTLEEPPPHVVFILATTNPEKLIPTIRSRAFPVNFKKGEADEIVRALLRVVKGEKLKADKKVLTLIASRAEGSFRDAVKILESLVLEKIPLTESGVSTFFEKIGRFDAATFVLLLDKGNKKEAFRVLANAERAGMEGRDIILGVLAQARASLLAKASFGCSQDKGASREDPLGELTQERVLALISLFSEAYSNTRFSPIDILPVEVAAVLFASQVSQQKDGKEARNDALPENAPAERKEPVQTSIAKDTWNIILANVRKESSQIEALLRAARPIAFDGKNLTLGVFYRFHKERLEEPVFKRILEEVVSSEMGMPIRVVCTLSERGLIEEEQKVPPEATQLSGVLTDAEDADIIKVAEEIFGG